MNNYEALGAAKNLFDSACHLLPPDKLQFLFKVAMGLDAHPEETPELLIGIMWMKEVGMRTE